jgi:prepilin-type N-terminal cleavage/methylation domain-containing protein/prepilin-type processing-associated H-X9-DG protein
MIFKHKTNAGFTLMELLIVLAIIVVLVALFFPVFVQARERGRRDACLSNERQLAMAMFQYAEDFDSALPPGNQGPAQKPGALITRSPVGWAGQIYGYVKDVSVFACPDDLTSTNVSWTWNPGCGTAPTLPPLNVVSYGYNERILDTDSAQGNLYKLAAPSTTVLLFEVTGVVTVLTNPMEDADICWETRTYSAAGDGTRTLGSGARGSTNLHPPPGAQYATGWLGGINPATFWPAGANVTFYGSPGGRHQGGSNFLMADGHARWVLPEYVQTNALQLQQQSP